MKKTVLSLLLLAAVIIAAPPAFAADNPPGAGDVTPDPWPKTAISNSVTYTIYHPALESWDGYTLQARAAVSVQEAGAEQPVFGALTFTAYTLVDRVGRTVHLQNFAILKLDFPTRADGGAKYRNGFLAMASPGGNTISLDRLEALLAIEGAEQKGAAVPVSNDPPNLVFSQQPAMLVPIDGEPVWRPIDGTSLQRVLNSRAFIVSDTPTGVYYLHLFDGFVTANSLNGPWVAAKNVPKAVKKAATDLAKQQVVDLLEGEQDPATKKKPSLKAGAPKVVVATVPTELIVSKGAPDWAPITGTSLFYMANTTANVFRNMNDQMVYVLVTGRWFRAVDFSGPWQYVPGPALPPDFARIPDDSPKENVKASVPGTPQAREAVIAAGIPQTATVYRDKATFTQPYTSAPELKSIAGTNLMYVFNSPVPVIMVSSFEWYALQNGIWFSSTSAQGPWTVASSVPAAIYAIPASSPLHYVTYVKVYDATPSYVIVGYTPGYMGTVVTPDGTVVYGTGYVYPAYVGATVWYPPPVTYGYAAAVTYTPWTGWAVGFGFGWATGVSYACAPAPYWGAMPYAYRGYAYGPGGAAAWGPGGWAATTGNVYQKWGSTTAVSRSSAGYNAWTGNAWSNKVGTSYNSTTGRISAGQQASVANVYTGNYASGQRGATYNPATGTSAKGGSATWGNAYTGSQNSAQWGKVSGPGGGSTGAAKVDGNYYASHDGNVYKDTSSGWQKYDNGSWNSVQKPQVPQSVQSQPAAKSAGDSRSAGSSWGSSGWGGGFNRGAGSAGGASDSASAGKSGGGFDRGGSGGGWDRGGGFGGGDRGFGGGGDRSWGGGGFGGGGGGFGGRRR